MYKRGRGERGVLTKRTRKFISYYPSRCVHPLSRELFNVSIPSTSESCCIPFLFFYSLHLSRLRLATTASTAAVSSTAVDFLVEMSIKASRDFNTCS